MISLLRKKHRTTPLNIPAATPSDSISEDKKSFIASPNVAEALSSRASDALISPTNCPAVSGDLSKVGDSPLLQAKVASFVQGTNWAKLGLALILAVSLSASAGAAEKAAPRRFARSVHKPVNKFDAKGNEAGSDAQEDSKLSLAIQPSPHSELKWVSPASRTTLRLISNSTGKKTAPEVAEKIEKVNWQDSVKDAAKKNTEEDAEKELDEDDPFTDPFGDANEIAKKPLTPKADNHPLKAVPSTLSIFSQASKPNDPQPEEDSLPPLDKKEPKRTLEQELAREPPGEFQCPSSKDIKPIRELKIDIALDEGTLPQECPLESDPFLPRSFARTTFHWKASALCHKPLYFEQMPLERYGHSWGPVIQPFMSAAHFYCTVPLMPYKLGMEWPNECVYELGYYRPGDCAPQIWGPIPISAKGGLMEGGAWTAMLFLIP